MKKVIKSSLDIKDWFLSLDDNVDLWITDPPYPFNNKNGTSRFKYDGTDNMYNRLSWSEIADFCNSCFNHSNDGARFYIFSSRDGLRNTWGCLEDAGWTFRNLLVWDKKRMGMGYHWRNQSEYILYASNGKPKKYVKSKGNIFSYKKPRGLGQSAKPYEIWDDIMKSSLCEGDVCADPFSGSNPFLSAVDKNPSLLNDMSALYLNSY